MTGPSSLADAEQTSSAVARLKASHVSVCLDCSHPLFCVKNPCPHTEMCEVAQAYDRVLAACQALIDVAKVVGDDDPAR